jgi:hypothetical protein
MSLQAALATGALIGMLLGAMSAPMSAQADSATAMRPTVPKALADAGEYGENLYDAAKANDWTGARTRLTALQAAVKHVPVGNGASGQAKDSLERNLAALKRSVSRRQRRATMQQANQVTLNVADMTARYAPKLPVQVTRLDFYGRELEIWSGAGDASRLTRGGRARFGRGEEVRRTGHAGGAGQDAG